MENYFHYFTEIEEHFQRRRGTTLLLSTLDWALIETWKEQGLPLAAVLRGIDDAFDSFSRRPRRARKINSLAYCAQAVMEAAEQAREAALGANPCSTGPGDPPPRRVSAGPDPEEIAAYLLRNASLLERSLSNSAANMSAVPVPHSLIADSQPPPPAASPLPSPGCPRPAQLPAPLLAAISEIAIALRSLATALTLPPGASAIEPQSAIINRQASIISDNRQSTISPESLERSLTVLEEKLFAVLIASTPSPELLTLRAEADASLASYRRDLLGPQLAQLERQCLQKRLLEKYRLPRLSLFYMY